MALQANDILKVVLSLAFPDSVVAQNVFWVLFEADGGSADEQDALNDLEDWIEGMYTRIISNVADRVTLDDIKVYVYDSVDEDFDEVGDETVAVAFSNGNEMLPHGMAAVSNASTVDPDVQGRKYWGGFCEDYNDDGYLTGTLIANLALATGDWITPFTGGATGSGFIPGVWSPTRVAFRAFDDDTTTNLVWGYQRRRKPGVGI